MTEGIKHDGGKPRWELLPWLSTEAVVRVLSYGAAKYSDDNWLHVEPWRARYYAATLRHLVAWWGGERVDAESGESHLAHAAACVLIMLERERREALR